MVMWIRLTGSVFVSKMSKHGVSPREGLVTTDEKHDDHGSVMWLLLRFCFVWRVWLLYQRDNQNPYIEEEQTTQWSKEKTQKDKQRFTKHTYKTKDRVNVYRDLYI
jgi:hypothetical protein